MNTALFQQEMKNIEEYAQTLCDTLEENFKQDSIASYKRMAMTDSGYATKRLEEIENGTANLYKFVVQKGRKYLKIINQQYDDMGPNPSYEYRNGSVHAFIDRETGDVYKPASWNKPAKHVRFDMRIIKERTLMHTPSFVTWAGGYLYLR